MNEVDILIPAFIAGILVLATHIPLGRKVLERGVIFADLAIAQIAGLGIVIASMLEMTEHPVLVQLIAALGALSGAALLTWIDRNLPEIKEACIGLIFVLAATGGILLMSRDLHAGEHLKDLLVGQILWVSHTQLIATGILTAVLLGIWRWSLRQKQDYHLGFYALFSLAVTASVQLVGVYLVFASLIIPALSTYRTNSMRAAWGIGISGYGIGLLLSWFFDLPAGAAIVWAMAIVGCARLIKSRI